MYITFKKLSLTEQDKSGCHPRTFKGGTFEGVGEEEKEETVAFISL